MTHEFTEEWTEKDLAKLKREEPKVKHDIGRINKAVGEAIQYAMQFKDVDDGGTCNFDACYIRVPGMRKTAAATIPNVSLFNTRWHGRTLHLHGTYGQAARRTKMAEAQQKFLQENYPDLEVGMYYQMD